jgi:hypothetical protein
MSDRKASKAKYKPWIWPGRTPARPADFHAMTWREAETFVRELVERLPERIAELEKCIRSTRGYSRWRANLTRRSLEDLGPWLADVLYVRPLTAEERRPKLLKPLPKGITLADLPTNPTGEMPDVEFTDDSFSPLADVGFYLGEVLRKRNPAWHWCRSRARKEYFDCNQPILAFGVEERWGYMPFVLPRKVMKRMLTGLEGPRVFVRAFDELREDLEG